MQPSRPRARLRSWRTSFAGVWRVPSFCVQIAVPCKLAGALQGNGHFEFQLPLVVACACMVACREQMGRNPCDRRRNTGHYRKHFPAVDWSLIAQARIGSVGVRHLEIRGSLMLCTINRLPSRHHYRSIDAYLLPP